MLSNRWFRRRFSKPEKTGEINMPLCMSLLLKAAGSVDLPSWVQARVDGAHFRDLRYGADGNIACYDHAPLQAAIGIKTALHHACLLQPFADGFVLG
jgi:hypothetical protein